MGKEVKLDEAIFAEVNAWGRHLHGFKAEHTRNALIVAQGYIEGATGSDGQRVEGIGDGDRRKLCLFATDLAWTFWQDETFDSRAPDERSLLDVEAVVRAIRGEPALTEEAQGFVWLRRAFADYARHEADYLLWQETAAAAVLSWSIEERLSKGLSGMSYSEYVENGFNSTAVPHLVATASLLHGFGLARRNAEETVRRLVRNLSISCRLHNDLFSVDKERREGCLANAVLLLEKMAPGAPWQAFVADDLKGYDRMIDSDAASLGPIDPFARLAKIMPAAHHVLYTTPHGQYSFVG